jgi:hypothetical protein
VNKVSGKRSLRLLARFVKFSITTHLPLRQLCIEGCHLQCELRQADHRLHPVIIVREPQVTYGSCSQIMSYMFNMLICVGMIFLDNLPQCFMFIAMIDLSRTCGIAASLIYYAMVIFMIYHWIKIKLKVLIFSTMQKPYCRHFSFMAEFVDALRPMPFTDVNFKRWQMRVTLWLTVMNRFWVSEGEPEGELSPEKEKEYSKANTIFCDMVVGVLTKTQQDMYLRYKTAKEMWDTLNTEYGGSDVDTRLYIIEQYHDYQMVDGKSVVTHAHEIQCMVKELGLLKIVVPDKFVVGGIIVKLPPS